MTHPTAPLPPTPPTTIPPPTREDYPVPNTPNVPGRFRCPKCRALCVSWDARCQCYTCHAMKCDWYSEKPPTPLERAERERDAALLDAEQLRTKVAALVKAVEDRDAVFETEKTCGELSCDECNDRYARVKRERDAALLDAERLRAENAKLRGKCMGDNSHDPLGLGLFGTGLS